jgi:hypothetical protein
MTVDGTAEPPSPALPAPADTATLNAIVDSAIGRYITSRRARITPFVDANYGFIGSLKLHRHAVGWDLLRAPANVALVLPYLAKDVAALGLSRSGAERPARWLKRRELFLQTDVARELAWRLHTDFLELPYDDGYRRSDKDALAETILTDPRLAALIDRVSQPLLAPARDPASAERLRATLGTYAGTRSAAAEIVSNVILAGAGATLFHQLTPGAISLGPVIAAAVAQQAAIAAFPLGAGLGGVWYSAFAATPSAGLVAATTGGVVALAAATAAFAGVVADPVQRALGLHQRRLHKLIDALEPILRDDAETDYHVRDHYVARVFDLIDVLTTLARAVR